MNQRTKTLLGAFVGVVLLAVGMKIYPTRIRPLFEGDSALDKARAELDDALAERDELEQHLTDQYRSIVLRNGGVDVSQWRDELYEALNALRTSVKLGGQIRPKPPQVNARTKVTTLKISVTATGTFEQCVDFVRGFYKLPFVARLASLKLVPTPSGHKLEHDEVRLEAEIEAMLLPAAELWGEPKGKRPEENDRVASADVSMLRNWRPFTPFVEREPVKPTVEVATGPTEPTPTPPPPPPPPGGPDEWADASELVLKMVGGYGSGDYWVREVLLENVMDFSTRYVAAGEDLDGGELVLVHALGAVVHKTANGEDYGYWVYPIGELLNARQRLEDSAVQWPEIYVAARQYLQGRGEAVPAPAAPAVSLTGGVAAALTDADKDALLRSTAAELLDQMGEGEMGPPLPPAMVAGSGVVENNTEPADDGPGGAEAADALAAEEDVASNALAAPRRTAGSPVQEPESRRAATDRTRVPHHPTPTATPAPAVTPRRPAIRHATPTRGPRQPAGQPDENPNEETDDVAPPE